MRRRRSPPRLLDAVRRSTCGSFDVEATLNGERDFRWHRLPEMDAGGLLLLEAARSPRETWPGGTAHEWQALRVFGTEGRGFESFPARTFRSRPRDRTLAGASSPIAPRCAQLARAHVELNSSVSPQVANAIGAVERDGSYLVRMRGNHRDAFHPATLPRNLCQCPVSSLPDRARTRRRSGGSVQRSDSPRVTCALPCTIGDAVGVVPAPSLHSSVFVCDKTPTRSPGKVVP